MEPPHYQAARDSTCKPLLDLAEAPQALDVLGAHAFEVAFRRDFLRITRPRAFLSATEPLLTLRRSQQLAALGERDVTKIYLSELGITDSRAAILDAFDQGASFMSYAGQEVSHFGRAKGSSPAPMSRASIHSRANRS